MILLSACLAGLCCRYDGRGTECPEAADLLRRGAVPLCPEQLGGMTTPRPPCEIQGGDGWDVLRGDAKICDENGHDWSAEFLRGAQEVLVFCRRYGVTTAWLKSNSPSCGCGAIYDGSFSGVLRPGDGVTTALLKKNGVVVRQL